MPTGAGGVGGLRLPQCRGGSSVPPWLNRNPRRGPPARDNLMKVCLFGDARTVHLQRIAPGLASRGAEVHVVSHQVADIPAATVERFRIPGPSLANPRPWPRRWAHYLRSFLKRFDVVQVHYLHNWGFTPEIIEAGCFLAFPWGSDIVPAPDAAPPPELVESRIALLRHAHGVAVCSGRFAGQVAAFAGIDREAIDLLPFGVDLSQFQPAARPGHGRRGPLTVGFFKGFRPVYGPTVLIRAVPAVLAACPDTRFELVGDGPQLDECQTLARDLGVQGAIRWLPRQPHAAIRRLLADWDVNVIPSVSEAFGVAALEAAAMGVPSVASNVGGLPDTVRDGETGLLVQPGDPDRVAAAIITLLQNDERRHAMSRAGRARVERDFDWQHTLDRWMAALHAALDRRRSVLQTMGILSS